ncbi:hypothetical protein OHS33_11290 [Streptomyces sp. NBC_00536]|uniref:hypothetical protein n=1 Tax=Streptomyces sp. NBC_00536 TaxID=2975769 RepID=UPI002E812520|nr:hypothetical protein [Streptomyces sp. NBC_00536]WUC78871.1 hypothetical protein OHS33_11290 [Streptomyces sp. NBC_00536]
MAGEVEGSSSWIQLQKEYVVLEISTWPGRGISVRISSEDNGTPVLFDSRMFETTSEAIPPHWISRIGKEGSLEIGPPSWLVPGFWERFFDQVSEAVEDYEGEMAKTIGFEA